MTDDPATAKTPATTGNGEDAATAPDDFPAYPPAAPPATDAEPEGARHARLATELALAEANRTLQVADSHAASTRRAYEGDWKAFRAWCGRLTELRPGLDALSASDDTLSLYVGALDHLRPSTVRRAIAAIRLAHERAGYLALLEACPATTAAIRGHERRHARTPPSARTAATAPRLEAMADTLETDTVKGARDRAVLLVGFDLAARRSELVGLDIEDLEPGDAAWLVRFRGAKGDKAGVGQTVALRRQTGSPYCPVAALERWLAVGGRKTGPVFVTLRRSRHCSKPGVQRMSDRAVARLVKATAAAAGLHGDFSGNSLRRGLITSAIDAGAPLRQVSGSRSTMSMLVVIGVPDINPAVGRRSLRPCIDGFSDLSCEFPA